MKYGFKSFFRTPVKSTIYVFLLSLSILLISLGIGMLNATDNMLNEADKVFTTIFEMVYDDGNDSIDTERQESIKETYKKLDLEKIAGNEVIFMEENITQKAYIEGYIPDKSEILAPEAAVLTISVLYFDDQYESWCAQVMEANYSGRDMLGKLIYISNDSIPEEMGPMEVGRYIVCGNYRVVSGNVYMWLNPYSQEEMNSLILDTSVPSIISIKEESGAEEFWKSETGKAYETLIATQRVRNQSLDIIATGYIEGIPGFSLGEYTLEEGTYFDSFKEDKAQCMVPYRVASQMNLKVGDSISISIQYPMNEANFYQGFYAEKGFADEREYEITGIYQGESSGTPIFINHNGQDFLDHSDIDPIFARGILHNRQAKAYAEQVRRFLPEKVRLDIIDQGYQASIMPVHNMRQVAGIMIAVSLIVGILILWLYMHLYLSNNKETIKVLMSLGTGIKRTVIYLATSCGVTILLAVTIGSNIGYFLSGILIKKVYSYMEQNQIFDYRFSSVGYGIKSAEFTQIPYVDYEIFLLLQVVSFIILFVIFSSFIFLSIKFRNSYQLKLKRIYEKNKITKESKQLLPASNKGESLLMRLPFVSLRYGVRNIIRNGKRSLLVPGITMVLIIALCTFSFIRNGLEKEYEQVYDHVKVTMAFTDITGRHKDNLSIPESQVNELVETGFVEKVWTTSDYYGKYMGVMVYADGSRPKEPLERFELPQNSFALETIKNQWKSNSSLLVVTNSIEDALKLYYPLEKEIEWGEEADWEDTLVSVEPDGLVLGCIVPKNFLNENHLAIGDALYFALPYNDRFHIAHVIYTIAGTYENEEDSKNSPIFVSGESLSRLLEIVTTGREQEIKWNKAKIWLQNTDNLSQLKDWMETKYELVGRAGQYRKWAVLDDQTLYNTLDRLDRYTKYMDYLYPLVCMLILGISFWISYTLLKNRVKEMAVLRSVGTSKKGIFFSFFTEAFLLFLPSLLCSEVLQIIFINTGIQFAQSGFILLICYLIGAIMAIMLTLRKTLSQELIGEE